MTNIAIVGGGASGMAAALAALEGDGNRVTIYERQSRLGRKLLSTGNGRCNLTNRGELAAHYHGDRDFAMNALRRFDTDKTLAWFASLGLMTVTEPSGRVYPLSDTASGVLDCLRFALTERGAQTVTDEIRFCAFTGRDFVLRGTEGEYRADRLIIAAGGAAGARIGGGMAAYKLLSAFGHGSTPLSPALVQLKTDNRWTRPLKGVRCNCGAALECGGTVKAASRGEVQFTDYGVSGPAIFDISRAAARTQGEAEIVLDLLPELSKVDIINYLNRKKSEFPSLTVENIFTGALHNAIARALIRRAGIPAETRLRTLDENSLSALVKLAKRYTLPLQGTMGFDGAQVTAGGVETKDFDPVTMESRLCPGLFACGEALDVDGDCGGYNLQWAWSSGRAAGLAAGGAE